MTTEMTAPAATSPNKPEMSSCFFCSEEQHESDSEDDFGEDIPVYPTKKTGRKISACTDCLVWCPEVYMKGKTWHNIDVTLKRCKRLKCAMCKKTHAPLGCRRMGCRKTFHHPCAMKANCVFDEDNFVMACFVCHEVMAARARKKEAAAAQKAARKKEAAAAQKAEKAARKKEAAEQKKGRKKTKKAKSAKKEKAGKRKALTSIESNSESPSLAQKRPAKKKQPAAPVPPEVVTAHRLRPVLADLFRKLRKDDLPVETVHTALTEFDASTGRKETSRGGLEKALRVLEAENRIMYRSYDGNWTVFLI